MYSTVFNIKSVLGRSRYKFYENQYPYFITSTVNYGLPLFSDTEIARIVLESLEYLQEQLTVKLFAYVIMDNHVHMVMQSKDPSKHMNSFKSFTAKEIIKSLKQRRRSILLKRLGFHKKLHKTQSNYQVWEEGVHPIQIDDDSKMNRILDYIHYNPVNAGFIDDPIHWRYSSARNYANRKGLIEVILFNG